MGLETRDDVDVAFYGPSRDPKNFCSFSDGEIVFSVNLSLFGLFEQPFFLLPHDVLEKFLLLVFALGNHTKPGANLSRRGFFGSPCLPSFSQIAVRTRNSVDYVELRNSNNELINVIITIEIA